MTVAIVHRVGGKYVLVADRRVSDNDTYMDVPGAKLLRPEGDPDTRVAFAGLAGEGHRAAYSTGVHGAGAIATAIAERNREPDVGNTTEVLVVDSDGAWYVDPRGWLLKVETFPYAIGSGADFVLGYLARGADDSQAVYDMKAAVGACAKRILSVSPECDVWVAP